jgi:hypothetical protein
VRLLPIGLCLIAAIISEVPFLSNASAPLGGDEGDYYGLGVRLATGRGFSYVPVPWCPVPEPRCEGPKVSEDDIQNLLRAEGVPTARRSPGLPMILAGMYRILGSDHTRMRLALAVITIFTAPALCLLCLLVFDRKSIALLAGLVWSVLPTNHRLTGLLLGESIGALLLTVGLVLTVVAGRTRSLPVAGLAGVALGYAALTRGYLLLAIVGPAVWLVTKRFWREATVLLLVVAVMLGAWTTRNFVSMGTLALSTETDVLWQGNNRWARGAWPGDWAPQKAYLQANYPGFDRLDEVGHSRLFLKEAAAEIVHNPARILWLLPRKAAIFFAPSSYLGFDWVYLILLPFSVAGLISLILDPGRRRGLWLLGFPILGVLIICLVSFGDPRFRHPVDPLLVSLACVGFVKLPKLTRQALRQAGPDHQGDPYV